MFNKILCATDLNKENDPAITKAVQVAHQFNSSIIILNVHDEFMEKEEAEEEFENYGFTEPMVCLLMSPMLYADTTNPYQRIPDKDLFESEGIDINDIHPSSTWGDG